MDNMKGSFLSKFLIAVVFFISILTNGGVGEISTSEEEDMELERQLKVLNKPPIKTVITKMGDMFDCVNIYKQPAFDHPLLKDHKIQMEPSFTEEETISKAASAIANEVSETILDNDLCPSGTVPIRRTTKEDLVHSKYLYKGTSHPYHINPYPIAPMLRHFVYVEPFIQGKVYYGGKAKISVDNPKVESDQFNTAQIWVQNGPQAEINSIEVGLTVYPLLTSDNVTRLFGYWTADGHKKTGCFNMLCSGFVQIHPRTALGHDIKPVSTPSWPSALSTKIYRDPKSGNWWLIIGKNHKKIGYWPKELFTHLSQNASVIRYGGVAGAKTNGPTPPMGNGRLPKKNRDFVNFGFMTGMNVVNHKGVSVRFDASKVRLKQVSRRDCYDIRFKGYKLLLGLVLTFGGPGGLCN